MLLKWLKKIVERNGEDWVKRHRQLLLDSAEKVVNLGPSKAFI
ncbi:MAG: hypothetical protein ACYS76_07425 [Planctomycetota bacterium]|jgi:hypothetical protein